MKEYPDSPESLQWEIEVPLVTNRFIMYDLVKVVAITTVICFLLVSGFTVAFDRRLSLEVFKSYAVIFALVNLGLFLTMVLVMVVVFWNRFSMRFVLSPQGARVETLSRVGKVGNRLAVILGVLGGRPATAGAGMVGMARETMSVRWSEVRRLNIHERAGVISLRNRWRVVLRLYCTPRNFSTVKAYVHGKVKRGPRKRQRLI